MSYKDLPIFDTFLWNEEINTAGLAAGPGIIDGCREHRARLRRLSFCHGGVKRPGVTILRALLVRDVGKPGSIRLFREQEIAGSNPAIPTYWTIPVWPSGKAAPC
jgi:hypothetical protein